MEEMAVHGGCGGDCSEMALAGGGGSCGGDVNVNAKKMHSRCYRVFIRSDFLYRLFKTAPQLLRLAQLSSV